MKERYARLDHTIPVRMPGRVEKFLTSPITWLVVVLVLAVAGGVGFVNYRLNHPLPAVQQSAPVR